MPLILSLSIALFLMLLSGLYEVKKKQAIKQTQTLMTLIVPFQIFLPPFLSPSLLLSFLHFFLSTVSLIEKKILIKWPKNSLFPLNTSYG